MSLISGWMPLVVDGVAILLLAVGLIRRPRRRPLLVAVLAALLGVGVGLFLCWLLSDKLDLFDVSLSPISRAWVAAAFGGLGVAIASAFRPGGLRRAAALVAIPAVLLAGGLGVNADFGQYATVGDLVGRAIAPKVPAEVLAMQARRAPGIASSSSQVAALWKRGSVAGSPARGLVGTVEIPATISHFAARPAYLYLPPAALVAHPIALPVLILLAGQPGGPENMVQAGKLRDILDGFAASHHGITPIVVVPDQLSQPQLNPMCVDSPIGNSKSYLTVDVPNWIRTHLTVQTSAGSWGIGGFSQGGTCSIQLGSANPKLFGSIFDISGQEAPKNGNLTQTIARGFGGDAAAYTAALPLTVLAKNAPYRNTVAVLVSGQLDTKYGPQSATVAAAARSAGMQVTRAVSPGTAHDWHTVQWALRTQLGPIYQRLGVERPAA